MKKIFLLAFLSIALISCNKDDDSNNNNCAKPSNIEVDQLNTTSVRVSWNDGGETAFEIEYGISGFTLGNGTVIQTSQTTFLINGLTPGTNYEVYVRSNCGSDGYSDHIKIEFVTLTGNPACNTPTDLSLGLITSNTVEFSWLENNETAWEIDFGIAPYTPNGANVIPTSQNVYTLTGLTPGTTYEIYVRANCGSDGVSEFSEALVVTTNP